MAEITQEAFMPIHEFVALTEQQQIQAWSQINFEYWFSSDTSAYEWLVLTRPHLPKWGHDSYLKEILSSRICSALRMGAINEEQAAMCDLPDVREVVAQQTKRADILRYLAQDIGFDVVVHTLFNRHTPKDAIGYIATHPQMETWTEDGAAIVFLSKALCEDPRTPYDALKRLTCHSSVFVRRWAGYALEKRAPQQQRLFEIVEV